MSKLEKFMKHGETVNVWRHLQHMKNPERIVAAFGHFDDDVAMTALKRLVGTPLGRKFVAKHALLRKAAGLRNQSIKSMDELEEKSLRIKTLKTISEWLETRKP
ncbi:MAG TPA: hypothetical protein VGQ00_04660 [Candidatus Norongarragalinales archaeon]|jgi:hypothetical protein|nr:hypothetical protein [Candidatus Norongarragalinales archaeon]